MKEEEEEEASQDKNLPPSLLSFIVGGTGNGGSERPSGRTAKVVAASAAMTEGEGKKRATMRAAPDSPNSEKIRTISPPRFPLRWR